LAAYLRRYQGHRAGNIERSTAAVSTEKKCGINIAQTLFAIVGSKSLLKFSTNLCWGCCSRMKAEASILRKAGCIPPTGYRNNSHALT